MRKICLLVALVLLLCGCGQEQTFETVADEMVLSASAQPRQVLLTLPDDTLLPAMETENGTLYLCNGYDGAVQSMESGDLDATVRQVCGFGSDDITIMQTAAGDCACYEFVWSAATELGEQVGRAMILEEGDYHYVVTTVAPAKKAGEYQEIWNGIFDSFALA